MNWTRAYLRPSVAASACASVDLPTPGNVLDQQVAAGEQAGEREAQRLVLADDDAVELREHRGEPRRGGRAAWLSGADGHGRSFGAESGDGKQAAL